MFVKFWLLSCCQLNNILDVEIRNLDRFQPPHTTVHSPWSIHPSHTQVFSTSTHHSPLTLITLKSIQPPHIWHPSLSPYHSPLTPRTPQSTQHDPLNLHTPQSSQPSHTTVHLHSTSIHQRPLNLLTPQSTQPPHYPSPCT